MKFQIDKENLLSEIRDLESYLDDLYIRRGEEKINIQIAIAEESAMAEQKIEELYGLIQYMSSGGEDIDFHFVAEELERLTGVAQTLTITWNTMLQEMFQDYSVFEQDMKTATDALNQMLFLIFRNTFQELPL